MSALPTRLLKEQILGTTPFPYVTSLSMSE